MNVNKIAKTVEDLQAQIKSWENDLDYLGHKFHSNVLESVSNKIKIKIEYANTAIEALCHLQIEITSK